MRPVYTLHRRQWVPRVLSETFAFFERPRNLPEITPPWLAFAILTPEPIEMAPGLTIDYSVRVLGWRTHWRTLISEYDPPHAFRDVQVIGPYRMWDHRHRFWREGAGSVIEDFVVYAPPLGPLGALLHRMLIRRQLREIFDFRRARIEERLGGPATPRRSGPAVSIS
jgi:ligand-binding SRPBCC domain-containing protein